MKMSDHAERGSASLLATSRRRFAGLLGALFCLSSGASAANAATGAAEPAGGAAGGPPADDRFAIMELMARYAWAYDTGNAQALAATFTEDGVLEVFGRVMVSGRGGFPAMIAEAAGMKGEHGWQHLTDHHIFRDYDGRRCTVYSYYTMPESDANGGNVTMRAMGYYVSDCVRAEGGWLFAKRSVVRWNGKAPMEI